MSFNLTLQIAILRAKRVAKSNFHRAVEILRAVRVKLEDAIRFVAHYHAVVA